MSKSPAEIILNRTAAYNVSDPHTIYGMYADNSEFIQWFPTFEIYKDQFFQLTAIYGSIQTEIISEKVKSRLSEVTYIDTVISEQEGTSVFYCKGYFTLTDKGWKILKEKKELKGK